MNSVQTCLIVFAQTYTYNGAGPQVLPILSIVDSIKRCVQSPLWLHVYCDVRAFFKYHISNWIRNLLLAGITSCPEYAMLKVLKLS